MKFEQGRKVFQPVAITLETEKEVMILGAALAKVAGNGVDDMFILKLYRELTEIADYDGHYAAVFDADDGAIRLEAF